MNTLPITMTNPADSHNNHSVCAGKRGLGAMPSNKQSAKGATFALLATMLRGRFQESMEPCSRKKRFHFVKTFGPKSPVKPSIQKNRQTQKRQQTLTPKRFPKFSKHENDFEGHVIWC